MAGSTGAAGTSMSLTTSLHDHRLSGHLHLFDDLFLHDHRLSGHLHLFDNLFDDGLSGDLDGLNHLFFHHHGLAGNHHLLDHLFGDGLAGDLDGLRYYFLDDDGLAWDFNCLRAAGRGEKQEQNCPSGDNGPAECTSLGHCFDSFLPGLNSARDHAETCSSAG